MHFRLFMAHVLYTVHSVSKTEIKPWQIQELMDTVESKLPIVDSTAKKTKELDDRCHKIKKDMDDGVMLGPVYQEMRDSRKELESLQKERVQESAREVKEDMKQEWTNQLTNQKIEVDKRVDDKFLEKDELMEEKIKKLKKEIPEIVETKFDGKSDLLMNKFENIQKGLQDDMKSVNESVHTEWEALTGSLHDLQQKYTNSEVRVGDLDGKVTDEVAKFQDGLQSVQTEMFNISNGLDGLNAHADVLQETQEKLQSDLQKVSSSVDGNMWNF